MSVTVLLPRFAAVAFACALLAGCGLTIVPKASPEDVAGAPGPAPPIGLGHPEKEACDGLRRLGPEVADVRDPCADALERQPVDKRVRVALIQQSSDPRKDDYERTFAVLRRLTDQALAADSGAANGWPASRKAWRRGISSSSAASTSR